MPEPSSDVRSDTPSHTDVACPMCGREPASPIGGLGESCARWRERFVAPETTGGGECLRRRR